MQLPRTERLLTRVAVHLMIFLQLMERLYICLSQAEDLVGPIKLVLHILILDHCRIRDQHQTLLVLVLQFSLDSIQDLLTY